MRVSKHLSFITIYFFLAVGMLGCSQVPLAMNSISLSLGSNASNIRDIKLKPDNEAPVYLQGKVTRQVPLVDWTMYQLQDSTGSIWVLARKTELQLADRVTIQGKVHYQSIPINSKEFGEIYIEEQKQLERIPTR